MTKGKMYKILEKEEIKKDILDNVNIKKLTKSQLRKCAHIKGEINEASFINVLNELEEEGKLYYDEDGYYKIFDSKQLGKVQGEIHINKTGQGFVFIMQGKRKIKYLINKENINGALDGDKVILMDINPNNKTHYADAKVEKVIKRNKEKAIFEYAGKGEFLPYGISENITVLCPKEQLIGLVCGDRVLVKVGKDLLAQIEGKLIFQGDIEKHVGHKDDPDIDIQTIAASHGFFKDFPKEVENQLKTIPDKVTEEELIGRKDLRNKTIFTIDGKDTKDMDDAISIDIAENGDYILGVHIADVTHYVKEGTPLYEQAKLRGTSAYLADSVIPMLPHQLSNGICSLNENEDRLTKTVEMIIDKDTGKIKDYYIFDSVINSKKKMNYDDVNKLLEENIVPEGYEQFIIDLLNMRFLAALLNENRKKLGKVDFFSDEIKVITSPTGDPIEFEARNQKTAERLIENFMIAANTCVAEYHSYLSVPFVYRTHGSPSDDNLLQTLQLLKIEGLCDKIHTDALINKIKNDRYTSNDLNEFINHYKNKETYPVISNLILRSMSKAIYSSHNDGHYGLGLKYYTHFTSPIRRFPDLEVHNLINQYYTYEDIPKILNNELELPIICSHSSFMEREADKAELETLDLKMAQYMQSCIGEIMKGQIIKMSPYDNEIRLENNIIGHVTPQDMHHAQKVGHNKKIKLGEKVYVLVKDVSVPHRVVYLSLAYKELSKTKQKVKK
ncbi:MAG: VacB/RNase II family 3'-5' exoribonuclease [Bacilli bacterium]|nr:VacB/RNase II family 3'-5' exoribonuclease [Bacilli bacterium]